MVGEGSLDPKFICFDLGEVVNHPRHSLTLFGGNLTKKSQGISVDFGCDEFWFRHSDLG